MEKKGVAVVTGASGFVGSHLVDLLISEHYTVRCITRKSSNLQWLKGKKVEIYDCGLNNKELLEKVLYGAEYVYHVAGVIKSKKPEGYFSGNVDNTKVLLEAALKYRKSIKKIVVVSSQTAVGPSEKDKPVDENSVCKPITTYGRSKLAEEELAKSYMNRLPITICRAPAVYGERDPETFIIFNTFAKGLFATIGFGEKKVSLIHADDLVRGFHKAAIVPESKGQTYFISSEEFYTWQQVGSLVSKILNKKAFHLAIPHFVIFTAAVFAQFFAQFSSKPATLNIEKGKDITRKYWTCNTSKAIKELGYHQELSIEDGLRKTLTWYKENNWIK
ncbi:MAG: NAD(P)-dependent oxidoreductase [Bacteroidota bacterium]|nr:NAD(P)-dependent oxidoreductase [Bacteroidota bacterium]